MTTMSVAAIKASPAPPVPTDEEIRQLLERILSSRQFANAPKKQKFLQLISDAYLAGRASELNEYMIGYEVFERDESYNPALDPIVRVGAHELRKKLEHYYRSEGQNDEILLEVPIGCYIPIFTRRERNQKVAAPRQPEPDLVSPASDVRSRRIWNSPSSIAFTLLTVIIILLAFSNRQLRRQVEEAASQKELAPAYGPVWEPFLRDGNPTLLVLSNPAVYRFWNPADPEPLSKISINLTPTETKALEETLGREQFVLKHNPLPRLVLSYDEYTGLGEAVGLYRLVTLFRGIGKSVMLKQSRTVSAEDMKNHNVILLGSVWVNEWSGKVLIKEDFVSSASAAIVNQNPFPGESREYNARFD